MKIAIFSDNFYPELSGISDSIITSAKALAQQEHIIHFYVPKYTLKNYRAVGLPFEEINLGKNISITRLFSIPYSGPTGQANIVLPNVLHWFFLVKKFKPDIIHSQLFFGAGLEALLAAKFLKIPLIGTNHTAIKEYVRNKWLKSISLKYAVWYYNQCDYVTAPSRSVFEEMEKQGFHKPHSVLSNPIDTEMFCPATSLEKQNLKNEFNFSEATILHVGRLSQERQVDVIIKGFASVLARNPDALLVLAGSGNATGSLKELARSLGILKKVRFLGILNKQMLKKVYQASDVFVIMSKSETQSLSLIQAMACGLPVIGARARALPEYINKNNGFLIDPGDWTALSEKIITLLKNPDLRYNLGKGGATYVQQFSISRITDSWEKLYQKVQR